MLFHWWSSPSEMAALDALSGVVKARYPDFAEKRTAAPPDRGAGLFAILQSLSKAGKPPDLVTMNTGYYMKPFVDAGLLARLDDLWISERLEKVIPPSLQAVNAFDGHYYSAPLDVHRTNLIWYNKRLLDKHGIDPASLTTLESFFDAATRLRAAGVSAPIQMAATWTTVQVFEGLMASQGTAVYRDWVNGKIRSASDPRLIQALGALKRYVGFANRDYAGLDWLVALRRVAAGQSAFYWMGDWANGDFRAAGLVYGKDYGVIVAPGTNGLYGVVDRRLRQAARDRAVGEREPLAEGRHLAGRAGRLQRAQGLDPGAQGPEPRAVRRLPEVGDRQLQAVEALPVRRRRAARHLRAHAERGSRGVPRGRRRPPGGRGARRGDGQLGLHARLVAGLAAAPSGDG